MGSKGGTTVMLPQAQTQTSSVAPNPVALQAYSNVVGQAQGLQGQNLGFAPQQQQAFGRIGDLQGVANPYLTQAGNYAGSGINAGNALIQSGADMGNPANFGLNIQQYMSPYLNDVVKSTMANINETNAQQQSQLTGNAIAQGATGGNRVGVAGAELARQQDLTNNSTLSNILQAGYGQAGQDLFQNAAMRMQAGNSLGSLGLSGANTYGNLGNEAMSTGLQGANALLQAGGMQQALPYQQLAWLSGIVGNQGPLMGQTGTQNSMGYTSQYAPQPNMLNSILGAGVAGAGLLARARGGAVGKAHGGGLGEYDPSYDDYGAPIGGGFGAIPEVRPTGAHGLQLPQFQALQQPHQQQQEQGRSPSFAELGRAGRGLHSAYNNNVETLAAGDLGRAGPGFADAAAEAEGEARGGRVRGYDDGGEVIDDKTDFGPSDSDVITDGGVVPSARAPRSTRNNNPGNLEDNAYTRGLPGYVGGDGRFARFESPEAGASAQDALLQSYGNRGYNTPAAIVGRWAPAAENGVGSTNSYVSHLASRLGVDPNTPLDLNDPNVRSGIRTAMADYEAGTNGQTKPMAYAGTPSGGGLGAINAAAPIEGRSADVGGVSPPDVPDAEPGFLERLGVPKISPDTKQALIAAGLGMMASKSHWLGPAIGEGGLQGIKTYYENQKNTRENALNQSTIGNRAGLLGVAQGRNTILGQEAGTHAANVASETQLRAAQAAALRAGLRETRWIPVVGWQMFDKAEPEKGWQKISGPGDPAVTAPPGAAAQPPSAASQPPSAETTPPAEPNTMPAVSEPGALGSMAWKPKISASALPSSWGVSTPNGQVPNNHIAIYSDASKLKQAQEKATKTLEGNAADAKSAEDVLYQLGEMDHAIDNLPKGGMLAQGAGATQRALLAKNANAVANFFHLPNVYSENEIGSVEDANKISFRLGAALSKSIGGREPGYIVEQAVKANPGVENTATGYRRVAAGLREAAQYKLDRNTFMEDYAGRFGHLEGAEEAFRQINPVEKYVHRAIMSTIDPRALQMLQEHQEDPYALKDFDEIYGKNAAKIALGEARPLTVRVPTRGRQ